MVPRVDANFSSLIKVGLHLRRVVVRHAAHNARPDEKRDDQAEKETADVRAIGHAAVLLAA
jgi:hypothetical protein